MDWSTFCEITSGAFNVIVDIWKGSSRSPDMTGQLLSENGFNFQRKTRAYPHNDYVRFVIKTDIDRAKTLRLLIQ